jgi:hypothetical protein
MGSPENPAWRSFVGGVPWFVETGTTVSVGTTSDWRRENRSSPEFRGLFPALGELLDAALLTPVEIGDERYELLTWGSDAERPGWLCLPPVSSTENVFAHHRVLLHVFGGIVERANEPSSWLLNHNSALTEEEASHDATFLLDHKWAFESAGIEVPIDLTAHYSVAREANGNTTLCHRGTGEIVLFAPDHSFDFVTPLDSCPDYTLYKMRDAPDFRRWVEVIATQWR